MAVPVPQVTVSSRVVTAGTSLDLDLGEPGLGRPNLRQPRADQIAPPVAGDVMAPQKQLQQYDGRLATCPPKTPHSTRAIALDHATVAALRAQRDRLARPADPDQPRRRPLHRPAPPVVRLVAQAIHQAATTPNQP
jgi:hypothetical protein